MRLIDADELIVMEYGGIKFVPKEFIDDAPTVDAVEVIRCWQCKHKDKGENESGSWNCCSIWYCNVEDDYFCWWAERRQDGTACNNY